MIVSIKHRFAFFCTPKNASTSIEQVLTPYADVLLTGSPALKHLRPHEYRKDLLPLIERKHPGLRIESFCLMREPLDWANSWYRYRSRPLLKDPARPNHQNYTGNVSFNEFIEAVLEDDPPPFARIGRQSAFICGPGGKEPLVDHMFAYERLEVLALYLSERIGKAVKLPRENVSPRRWTSLAPELEARFVDAHAFDYELFQTLG